MQPMPTLSEFPTQEPATRAPVSLHGHLPVLVVLLACLWVVGANLAQGPLLSQDSESYLLLAQSLTQRGQYALPYVQVTPRVLLYGPTHSPAPWAPGYPALTALLGLLLPLPLAARLVALIASVLAVCLVFILARRLGSSRGLAALAAAVFAVAPATTIVVPYLWSEPPFTVAVLLALIALASPGELSDRRALRLGAWGAAACLVRYNGVTLVAALVLAVCWQEWRQPPLRLLRHLLFSAGLPACALFAWLVRNKLVTGAFEASRAPGTDSFWHNLGEAAKSLVLMLAGGCPENWLLAALLALCLVPLALLLRQGWCRLPAKGSLRPAALVLLFPVVHMLLLAVMRTQQDFDPLGPRLLWPALPALLAAVAALVQRLAGRSTAARALAAVTAGLVLCAGLLTLRENLLHVIPQMHEEARTRAQVAHDPGLQPLVRGKRVLIVETWPLTVTTAGAGAAAVWATSPYAFGVQHFDQPGPWRDWLAQIDAIIAIDRVTFSSPGWRTQPLCNGAVAYLRR